MAEKSIIYGNTRHIFKLFFKNIRHIHDIAVHSTTPEIFKTELKSYLYTLLFCGEDAEKRDAAREQIIQLIENDNTLINEFSTGKKIHVKPITHLWKMLREKDSGSLSADLFIDLYKLFGLLFLDIPSPPGKKQVKQWMKRWPGGLEPGIISIRNKNKERIINKLIPYIEKKESQTFRYKFAGGSTYDEKHKQVEEWWNTARFHLTMAIKNPATLNNFLDNSLSDETMNTLNNARKKGIPFFITPYYLSLLNIGPGGYDDNAIRSYIIYSRELTEAYGSIMAWEKEDTIEAGKPNAAGWLLPEGHNIHRRYPEVAILIPDSMGRACGGLCASCQRMYDFQSQRFNFDLEQLKPKEGWNEKLGRLMQYFETDSQLRDILITGGDAFMSRNSTLRNILNAVYSMAVRKRSANKKRADGEKYAELQRVRLGSRLLAYLPMRIDSELIDILREFKEKASAAGVSQFIVQTHFQTPLEVTPEAKRAIKDIISAGWVITNQLVYNVAASRRGHTAKLRQVLNEAGVVCYYTFSVKGFEENYAVFTPNCRSLQEQSEEKIFGAVSPEKQQELYDIITKEKRSDKKIKDFLHENDLPFAATDRNVLNLPAIGKSMTFTTVGITDSGKRVLKFHHDKGRNHSPVINNIKDVYIMENKSVAAYMRQLGETGEDVREYLSVWGFMKGETEPRFHLYKYGEYPFNITKEITNIDLQNRPADKS